MNLSVSLAQNETCLVDYEHGVFSDRPLGGIRAASPRSKIRPGVLPPGDRLGARPGLRGTGAIESPSFCTGLCWKVLGLYHF